MSDVAIVFVVYNQAGLDKASFRYVLILTTMLALHHLL